MAISQFYKDNSHTDTFTAVKNPFDFKTTWDLETLFTGTFDDTIAFSSNMLPFYHNYQYGEQFQYFTNVNNIEPNPNFTKFDVKATKLCLLYSTSNTEQSIKGVESSYYIYDSKNNETGWNNISNFNEFRLVTEFPFDRLVVAFMLARNNYTDYADYNYSYYDNITDDNQFNKFVIKLYYRNDDYTLTDITGYFILAEVIKTEDNILISTLSNKNVNGTPTSFYTGNATSYTETCPHVKTNYFLHTATSENMETVSGVQRIIPDDENTGLNSIYMWSWTSIIYYDLTYNKQLAFNICASIGLRFITCNPSEITDKNTYDEKVKLAYMEDNGYVDYNNILSGADEIENSDTYNKTIDLNTSPNIPDEKMPYPDSEDKIKPVDYRYINEIGGFTRYYKVSREQLATIITTINTAEDLPDGYEFLPHIVSVRQYPFNTSQYAMGHSENIVIGGYDTGVTGLNLDSTLMGVHTIAEITIPSKYKSFLDKSPYTQLSLYIPCCGWVDLPDICVGRTINVEIAHDIINGGCIGIVKLNGMPIVQTAGKMGTDISISAIENGLKQAALTQSAFNVGGGVLSTGFALATGNPVGVFSGIMSTASALSQGNIANNSNYTHQIGTTGDKSNDHISTKCYLRISFPLTDIPQNFGHVYGYICNQTHKLSECKGFTVCDRVDLSGVTATDNEKARLKQILETGFYC